MEAAFYLQLSGGLLLKVLSLEFFKAPPLLSSFCKVLLFNIKYCVFDTKGLTNTVISGRMVLAGCGMMCYRRGEA